MTGQQKEGPGKAEGTPRKNRPAQRVLGPASAAVCWRTPGRGYHRAEGPTRGPPGPEHKGPCVLIKKPAFSAMSNRKPLKT